MKQPVKRHVLIAFLLAAIFCMFASAALAADAAVVELNGETLNAANPYWKNGGGGSASDWNAYFDTGTSMPTLYLKDAVVDTMNVYDELIYADGDIHIVLLGNNSLSYTGSSASAPAGVVCDGDLVLSDGTADSTGSLTILISPGAPPVIADGLLAEFGDITIYGGTIEITLYSAFESYGIYAEYELNIHGGTIDVYSFALAVSAVSATDFYMTGGDIKSTADAGFEESHALLFYRALVTGGTGTFASETYGFGGVWADAESGSFRVIDGQMIFTGQDEALFFETEETITPAVTDRIYASLDETGAGKFVWNDSMDILAGNLSAITPYRYVELLGDGSELPITGDASTPLLWAGIILAVLLFAAAAVILRKRRR